MLRFIFARLIQFPLILAVIYLITFLLTWVAPGSPFEGERKLDPVAEKQLKRQFHAEHWYTFLGHYPKNLLTRGDFGPSLFYREWTVNDIMRRSLPIQTS